MITGDGIHYNRWQRNRELSRALQSIVQERGLDVKEWKDRWWTLPRQPADRDIYYNLLDALMQRTGCQLDTARHHVHRLLRLR